MPSHARAAAGHGGLALGAGDDDDDAALSPRTRLTRSGLAGNIAADKVKSASDDKRKGKRKRSDDDDEDFIAGDMPVDPNECVGIAIVELTMQAGLLLLSQGQC